MMAKLKKVATGMADALATNAFLLGGKRQFYKRSCPQGVARSSGVVISTAASRAGDGRVSSSTLETECCRILMGMGLTRRGGESERRKPARSRRRRKSRLPWVSKRGSGGPNWKNVWPMERRAWSTVLALTWCPLLDSRPSLVLMANTSRSRTGSLTPWRRGST